MNPCSCNFHATSGIECQELHELGTPDPAHISPAANPLHPSCAALLCLLAQRALRGVVFASCPNVVTTWQGGVCGSSCGPAHAVEGIAEVPGGLLALLA